MSRKKTKRAQAWQPKISPAGMRSSRLGDHNQPIVDDESLAEEYQWREEHIQ